MLINMKKNRIVIVLMGILSFSSCADFFETDSPSTLGKEDVFSNLTRTEQAIAGIYDQFGQDRSYRNRLSCGYQGLNTDIEYNNKGSDTEYYTYNYQLTGNLSRDGGKDPWGYLNTAIERANDVIEGIREYGDTTNTEYAYFLGEALFLRSFVYLEMVKFWGDLPPRFESLSKNPDGVNIAKNDRNIFYTIYEDKMVYDMVESKTILDKLINAVENDLLEIYLQPKFDCKTNKMIGSEALLRLKENNKFISPAVFIPIAEETGFITTIDSYVFEKVCKIINEFKSNNIFIGPVSINVSRKKIEQFNLVEEYEEIMKKYNIKKDEIELEITEGTILSDNTIIQKVIKKIKKSKFKLLVDDFGTGYSSISMLKSLDIDGIKIDRSFIIDETEKGKEILKYVVKLGKSLNLSLTAEGVETKEQLDYLKKLNCDIIQGYYFSKPLAIEDFKKFIKGGENE